MTKQPIAKVRSCTHTPSDGELARAVGQNLPTLRPAKRSTNIRLTGALLGAMLLGVAASPPAPMLGPATAYAQETAKAPTDATSELAVWLDGKRIVIPVGTSIPLQIEQKISGKKARVGDPLDFTVTQDVKIGDTVVFQKGAAAKGAISLAKDAENWNKGSKLTLDVFWTTAADGRQIPTLTRFIERPRNESLNRIMTFGLLSPFQKGKNTNIKKGAKYEALVGSELTIPAQMEKEKQIDKQTDTKDKSAKKSKAAKAGKAKN